MKKTFIIALLALIIVISACGESQVTWSDNTPEPLPGVLPESSFDGFTESLPEPIPETILEPLPKSYTHEERLEILSNSALPMPVSFYDPELYEAYTNQLNVIGEEHVAADVVLDEEFTEFLSIYETLIEASSHYPTLLIQADEVYRSEYTDASITIIDGNSITEKEITIKIRGNSTSSAPKKPYNIKFGESVSLFDLEEGKKWSLLANMYDKTLIRNKLAFEFGRAIGLTYTSESEFVEVWMNGEYLGNYLLCEPISDGKNRIGIDTDEFDFILEIAPGLTPNYTTNTGVPLLYDSPENPTSEQKKYLTDFLSKMEAALQTKDMSQYSRYIDVNSFVDFYVTMELFKDIDCYTSSLYVYIEDGMLYAGPLWDFDLTCGNVSKWYKAANYYTYHNINGYGDSSGDSTRGLFMVNGWFKMLLEDPAFAEAVRERYIELQPLITALYDGDGNMIDTLRDTHAASFEREYRENKVGDHGAGWDVNYNYGAFADSSKGDYTANVEFLREWLRDRNAWLLENIGR